MPPASAAATAVAETFFFIVVVFVLTPLTLTGSIPFFWMINCNFRVSLDVVKFNRASTPVLAGGAAVTTLIV